MEKDKAIQKIKELEAKIAELKAIVDKPEKNKHLMSTKDLDDGRKDLLIDKEWVGTIIPEGGHGTLSRYHEETGNTANLFLCNSFGVWYDEAGSEVTGYLYFEPRK